MFPCYFFAKDIQNPLFCLFLSTQYIKFNTYCTVSHKIRTDCNHMWICTQCPRDLFPFSLPRLSSLPFYFLLIWNQHFGLLKYCPQNKVNFQFLNILLIILEFTIVYFDHAHVFTSNSSLIHLHFLSYLGVTIAVMKYYQKQLGEGRAIWPTYLESQSA